MTNQVLKLKNNFQLYFMHVATYCSWQKLKSIASGWVSLTQIICPLHQPCLKLAIDLAKGIIYLSLKLRKLCFQSCYLRLHILALLSTAITSTIVVRNVATFATLIAHASVFLGCTTSLSLPKHHWGITTNTSGLRCINWRFFKLRIEWPVLPRLHVPFSFATFGKNACIVQYIPNSLSSQLGIFHSTRLGAKHLN